MDKRILNPRTNRYVTVGSPAYRRYLRETEKAQKPQTKPAPVEDPESDLDDSMFSRKPSKEEKPEIIKKS